MSKSTANNVVHFDEKLRSQPSGRQSKRLTLLNKCKEIATRHLERSLPCVMDKVDDALFDLASHATDNQEQRVYFDTMREVRFERAAIEQGFLRAFTTSASEAIARLHKRRSAAPALESAHAKLGLVEEEDFEETLAITNMVQKIRTRYLEQLYALEQRVAKLGKRDEIEPEDDPYGPEIICNAFKTACSAIDANVDIRLVLLKLFDQQVVDDLEDLYEELNDRLARCGVLPEIRHVVKTDPRSGTRKPRGLASDSLDNIATDKLGQRSLDSAASRTGDERGGENEGTLADYDASDVASSGARLLDALNRVMSINGAAPGREDFSDEELRVISSLTALQQTPNSRRPELGSFDTTGVHTGTVNVLRDLKITGVAEGMRDVDVMMFDVVAMMFDFILDDRDMPAGMKALIGRLQIPVLKVALIDKSFFARRFHPARRLLNTLAETASGWAWEEEVDDVFYRKAESLVMRILEEFDERIELFEEVLEELESFLEEQERSVEENATASVGEVEGRERLAAAKQTAAEQIERRLAGTHVHHLVRDFVSSYWKELLFVRYFEEGEHGEGWKDALQSLDDLLWSVAPKTLPEDRKHLTDLLPGLLRRLRDGMTQLAMPTEASSRFLGIFKQLHIAAIRNEVCETDELPAALDDGEADIPSLDLAAWEENPETVDHADVVCVEEISLVQMAIDKANREIHVTAETHPECAGMGTTVVAAHFNDDRVTVANVGDSRLYRLRDDALERITSDHSLRQQLIEKGLYTPQEADENIQSNVLTRAVGADPDIDVDVQELAVEPGDLYLLCSDGLTDMVSDAGIGAILREFHGDLPTAVRELVELANRNGGCDNVSVVLVRVLGAPYDAAKPGEAPDASAFVEMEGATDVGLKRSHNEDHVAMDAARGIAIVADGMGGCNAGEVASEMAARIVLESLRTGTIAVEVAPPEAIRNAPASNAGRLSETTAAATALLDVEAGGPAGEPAQAPYFDEDDEPDEHLELVRELEIGSWVEFHRGEGAGARARLSWVSPETGRYLFTDRRGMKVADATAHGLAAELRRGMISLIEQVPLFDRIMVNITDHLRSGIPAG